MKKGLCLFLAVLCILLPVRALANDEIILDHVGEPTYSLSFSYEVLEGSLQAEVEYTTQCTAIYRYIVVPPRTMKHQEVRDGVLYAGMLTLYKYIHDYDDHLTYAYYEGIIQPV